MVNNQYIITKLNEGISSFIHRPGFVRVGFALRLALGAVHIDVLFSGNLPRFKDCTCYLNHRSRDESKAPLETDSEALPFLAASSGSKTEIKRN